MNARQRSWLLPPCAAALVAGVLVGRDLHGLLWPLLASAACLPAVFLLRGRLRFLACVLLALSLGASTGWIGFHPSLPPEGDYEVTGVISGEVTSGKLGQVRVPLSSVTLDGRPFSGGAYWTFYTEEFPGDLLPGKAVSFGASLYHPSGAENPEGYDFRESLLRKGITVGLYGNRDLVIREPDFFSLSGFLAALRHCLTSALIRELGEESGAYASALLLGYGSLVPSEDREAFAGLGIAHLLSVSGFHVGVIIGALALLFRLLRFSQRTRLAVSGVILFSYAFLCGMNPPILRAAILSLLAAEGKILQRPRSGIHLLSAAAAVSAVFAPAQVSGASFQLTYAAVFGLIWFTPLVNRLLPSGKESAAARILRAVLPVIGIQLAILWPELYHFQRLPLWGFLYNFPAMAVFTVLILLYWIALLLLPVAGLTGLLAAPLSFLTGNLLSLVRLLGSLPGQSLWIHAPTWLTALGILLLMAGSCAIVRLGKVPRALLCTAGVAATVLSLLPLPHPGTEYLQFSAGSADAAVLRDRERIVVMDTGEPGSPLSSYLRFHRLTPDAVILTHLHSDHAGGLDDLVRDQIPIRVLYLPEGAEEQEIHPDILEMLNRLRAGGTEIRSLSRGDVLPLPSGSLTVLWPEKGKVRPGQDANRYSLVSRLILRGTSLLHTGDVTGSYEDYAAAPSDILKAAHHGSRASSSDAFLEAVSPEVILLPCGTVDRAEDFRARAGGIPVWSTAESGALTVRFEEGSYTVIPFLGGDR